ncbi:hypothetical protein ACFFRR_010217 [Megaselia abdita]
MRLFVENSVLSECDGKRNRNRDYDEVNEDICSCDTMWSSSGQVLEFQDRNRVLGLITKIIVPIADRLTRHLRETKDVKLMQAIRALSTSRQLLANILAYIANTISLSLSSQLSKLRRHEYIDYFPSRMLPVLDVEKPKKCVTINILAEPPPGTPIRADIVLIHGLHGCLANTWKQGMWDSERRPVNFKRPPKPPIRPPKRPRHSRGNVFIPSYKEKRRRLSLQETTSFEREYLDTFQTNPLPEIKTFRLRNDSYKGVNLTTFANYISCNEADEDSIYSKCWPGDWLPIDCPGVRVIAIDYTTDKYLWRPVWKEKERRSNIVERAREMADMLIELKVGVDHPIVWVGHSKGGLFVKQILVDSWETGKAEAENLWKSATGVFFYSVPHRGSYLASVRIPFMTRSVELAEIEKNNKYLLDLHRRFACLYHMGHFKIEVFSFVETALTFMAFLYLKIVGVDSADPGIGEVCGLHLDHREICKPKSRACILYKELVNLINKVC